LPKGNTSIWGNPRQFVMSLWPNPKKIGSCPASDFTGVWLEEIL